MATTGGYLGFALQKVAPAPRPRNAARPDLRVVNRESWERHDRSTPVLVLQTRPRPLHHGTIGAVRSLGRVGVSVHASREAQRGAAAGSRYLAPASPGPLSGDPSADVLMLQEFQRRLGRPLAVLAVDDEGAAFLAENRDALGPGFLLPPQRPELPRQVGAKAYLPQLRCVAGVKIPNMLVVPASHCAAPRDIGYPLVVKITEPSLLPGGVPPVVLATGDEDLARYCASIGERARSLAALVLQEYIPDEAAEDWFYHGYHRAGGEAVVGFTGIKLRSHPPFFGATSYGVSIVNADVAALAQRLLRNLEYAGVVELEFRLDKRDGAYKLIDFNPRLGAQFQLLRNEHGVDVVRAMHLDLTNRETPAGRQVEWSAFVSDLTDPAAFWAYRRRGQVRPGSWLRQFMAAESRSWFARDDLRPFFAAALCATRRSLAPRQPVPASRPGRRSQEGGRGAGDPATVAASETSAPRQVAATANSNTGP